MSPSESSSPAAAADATTVPAEIAKRYAKQAEKLSLDRRRRLRRKHGGSGGQAVEANFITPLDPVIETADGNRLPVVPVEEAHRINMLKDKVDGKKTRRRQMPPRGLSRFGRIDPGGGSSNGNGNGNGGRDVTTSSATAATDAEKKSQKSESMTGNSDTLGESLPPSRTHPLFPPLPLYGPRSISRDLQCLTFRTTSFFLSTGFLLVIVLGAVFTSIPKISSYVWLWLTFRNPDARRPFHEEEQQRATAREEEEKRWRRRQRENVKHARSQVDDDHPSSPSSTTSMESNSTSGGRLSSSSYVPLEGGPDPLICDARHYARRVGLEMEEFKVQTEDGFIITLWHIFDPRECQSAPPLARQSSSPNVFTSGGPHSTGQEHGNIRRQYKDGNRRFPVLLMHGLLQSAGAYCCNDDDSLAFFLCKAGYDVWLGNNRCGFEPEHSLLSYKDPRMWAWNIRQMGVMDLPALVSRVLEETGFERVGLVCHSQGTTETFVALAKEQRPDLGEKISVFCALAPAVYAGPLIGKMYFKFMRVISPAMFRIFFGIHAFIPLMMTMHRWLPGKIYGFMGYQVFSFLFDWTDTRWDRGLRNRLFQFAPVYVSSESMRWWLGRECFAKHKCILSTKEEGRIEDEEDYHNDDDDDDNNDDSDDDDDDDDTDAEKKAEIKREEYGRTSWYNHQAPPMAFWVAGSDDLVDGRRLLRRFERGREPHVDVVHRKVIEEYEHLDVIWAVDAIEQVGKEVRDVLYRCMNDHERSVCRVVEGVCESDDEQEEGEEEEDEDHESREERDEEVDDDFSVEKGGEQKEEKTEGPVSAAAT